MKNILVEIICPKCSERAIFHSVLVGNYKQYPETNGKVTCQQCGFSGAHIFSDKDYFYKIPVGERFLFARDLNNLIHLRDFFDSGYKKPSNEPELDFPKSFYVHKDLIVKQINSILDREMGSH